MPQRTDQRSRLYEVSFAGLDRWTWLSLAAFVLAMLSKGSVAFLPLSLVLIIWWQQRRIDKGGLAAA